MVAAAAVALSLPGLQTAKEAGATTVPPAALEAVACLTSTQCVAVGGSRQIMVSSDGGQSWSARSDSDGHYLYGVACVSSTRCIAVGDAGTILISAKENQKWTSVGSGTTEPLSSVSCPGSGRCYAVGDGGTVLATDNSGKSWHDVASGSSVIDGVACGTPTQLCRRDEQLRTGSIYPGRQQLVGGRGADRLTVGACSHERHCLFWDDMCCCWCPWFAGAIDRPWCHMVLPLPCSHQPESRWDCLSDGFSLHRRGLEWSDSEIERWRGDMEQSQGAHRRDPAGGDVRDAGRLPRRGKRTNGNRYGRRRETVGRREPVTPSP